MITQIFINLGYILYLIAIIVHDVLWLRGILILAHISLVTYGIVSGNTWVAFWNTVFILINAIRAARIIRERRPIRLPSDLSDLYEDLFSAMSSREFLYFWETGSMHEVCDDLIIKEGERQEQLSLILSGTVIVARDGTVIARRSRGNFISEMSFISGETASADVTAEGCIKYISWGQEKLRSLKQLNPHLLLKVQNAVSKNLSDKIKASPTEGEQHSPEGKDEVH